MRRAEHTQTSDEIAHAVRGVSFPASKEALVQGLGARTVRFDETTAAPLADIARGVAARHFRDAEEARKALDARWSRIATALAAVDARERADERRQEQG